MRRLIPISLLMLGACAPARSESPSTPAPGSPEPSPGVLVMAHGGTETWNRTVMAAVAPLSDELPTAVAFGMADPVTLRSGLDSLRATGADRVAVVRMFVSGESFLEQTEYFLGMREERPANLILMGRDPDTAHPIDHDMRLATHPDGLMVSAQARRILVDRALAASVDRPREGVLLIAHGMGDDARNDRVLAAMAAVVDELGELGFAAARAATLREDWAEKRVAAEEEIRGFVSNETTQGRRVIVVPMRLSGFGPYAEVLAGLEYKAVDGLLPHREITSWLRQTATRVLCDEGWQRPGMQCERVAVDPEGGR